MNIVKKYIITTLAILLGAFSFCTPLAYATNSTMPDQDACDITKYSDPTICGHKDKDNQQELQNRIRSILNTIYLWIGIIAAIVIVIAGILCMISLGDAGKIQRAKAAILYAVIGLIVTLAAFAITNLVINALEGRH